MNLKIAFCTFVIGSIAFFGCAPCPAERNTSTPAATATVSPSRIRTPVPPLQYAFTRAQTGTAILFPEEIINLQNAANLTPVAKWGRGTINQVAWSPDGTALAVASPLGIFLYDAVSLRDIGFIRIDAYVSCLAFSPDANIIASGLRNGEVELWKTSNGELVRTLDTIRESVVNKQVTSIAFSGDGSMLASGSMEAPVRIWKVSDGSVLAALSPDQSRNIASLAFSFDGQTLAIGYLNGAGIWRIWDSEKIHEFTSRGLHVFKVALSPDGQFLATSEEHGTVDLWQVPDAKPLRTLEMEDRKGLKSIAFSPDGSILAVGSQRPGTIRLWTVPDGSLFQTLEGHLNRVTSVSFSPDGTRLASGSTDGSVRIWRLLEDLPLGILDRHNGDIESIAFSPDGEWLASGSWDGAGAIWKVSDGNLVRRLEGYKAGVSSVAFSPDGRILAVGGWDGTAKLWRTSDGSLIRTLEGERRSVRFAFSPDGEILAFSSGGTIKLLQTSDGTEIRTLATCAEECISSIEDLAFSPDGRVLAALIFESIQFWRMSDGALDRTLEMECTPSKMAFSPDGTHLAVGSWGCGIYVWRLSDGSLSYFVDNQRAYVMDIAFSPDSKVLASGSYKDGTIQLWRVSEGSPLILLEGHVLGVSSVAFSPDGRILASGSLDGTIRLWGVPG